MTIMYSLNHSHFQKRCFRHDRIAERRDFTCVFDLTSSDWKDYISNKC